MIWQLLQVRHLKAHPLILVGDMWHGLVDWMTETMLAKGLVSPGDLNYVSVVGSGDEALPIIREAFEQFRQE
jgi:hypothetical protein